MRDTLGATARPEEAGGRGCRCICGNLLARVTRRGVELKCRRCKRLIVLSWRELADETSRGPPQDD